MFPYRELQREWQTLIPVPLYVPRDDDLDVLAIFNLGNGPDWEFRLPRGSFEECLIQSRLLFESQFANGDCWRVVLRTDSGWVRMIWRMGEEWG